MILLIIFMLGLIGLGILMFKYLNGDFVNKEK